MDNVEIVIRPGKESDCFTLIKLMEKLAEHERISNVAAYSLEDLRRNAFHVSPPVVYTLVAEIIPEPSSLLETTSPVSDSEIENKNIVGYALYFKTYSTWKGTALHIENIFVRPEFRRKRIGEKLLQYIGQIIAKESYARISFECTNWNESGIKFFKKYGANDVTKEDHWESYRFTKEALMNLVS